MNQSELITEIGYRYRSASRNFVTTEEIKSELNRSIDRLSGLVDLVTTIVSVTIPFTGNGTYTFTALGITDMKRPISLFDRSNNILFKRLSGSGMYSAEDGGNNNYALTNTGINIVSTIASGTLTFTYYSTKDCTDSTGATPQKGLSLTTDIPLLQTRFHDYFVEDVAAVLFRKERKWDDYQIARSITKEIFKEITDENPTQYENVFTQINPYPNTYD